MKRLIERADFVWTPEGMLRGASVGIDGDRILFVGDVPNGFAAEEVISGKNRMVVPGLVNTHTHLPMTILRSYADGYSFHTWLFDKIMPVEDRLDADMVYWASLMGLAEMIRSGTTDFVDMYFFSESIAQAVGETGMRASITYPLLGGESGDFNARAARLKELIAACHGAYDGRMSVNVAPHAVYTNSPASLAGAAELAQEFGLTVHTHISESEKENADCLAQFGVSPTRLMYDVGLLQNRTIAAHCVYLSEEDMDIFKECDVTVAHNPVSNLKLGNGVAPVLRFTQRNIRVSLGTDGMASNNNLDMLEEMKLAGLLLCGVNHDPSVVQSEDLVQMATVNGALAQGFDDIGVVRAGAKADLILLNIDKPHWYPRLHMLNHLCFSANGADVDTVLVNGEMLMRNRELLTIDYEKVRAELNRCAEKLFGGALC